MRTKTSRVIRTHAYENMYVVCAGSPSQSFRSSILKMICQCLFDTVYAYYRAFWPIVIPNLETESRYDGVTWRYFRANVATIADDNETHSRTPFIRSWTLLHAGYDWTCQKISEESRLYYLQWSTMRPSFGIVFTQGRLTMQELPILIGNNEIEGA